MNFKLDLQIQMSVYPIGAVLCHPALAKYFKPNACPPERTFGSSNEREQEGWLRSNDLIFCATL